MARVGPGLPAGAPGDQEKAGEERDAVVYGVSRLVAERTTPSQLLALVRGHGRLRPLALVRDVTFDADGRRSAVGAFLT